MTPNSKDVLLPHQGPSANVTSNSEEGLLALQNLHTPVTLNIQELMVSHESVKTPVTLNCRELLSLHQELQGNVTENKHKHKQNVVLLRNKKTMSDVTPNSTDVWLPHQGPPANVISNSIQGWLPLQIPQTPVTLNVQELMVPHETAKTPVTLNCKELLSPRQKLQSNVTEQEKSFSHEEDRIAPKTASNVHERLLLPKIIAVPVQILGLDIQSQQFQLTEPLVTNATDGINVTEDSHSTQKKRKKAAQSRNPFIQCRHCSGWFSKSSILKHMTTHDLTTHGETQCPHCSCWCPKSELTKHMMTQCQVIHNIFTNTTVESHPEQKDKETVAKAPSQTSQEKLADDMSVSSTGDRGILSSSGECLSDFRLTEIDLTPSLQQGSRKIFRCGICNLKCENIVHYTNHLKEHSSTRLMATESTASVKPLKVKQICLICEKKLSTQIKLEFQKHENTGDFVLSCPNCKTSFTAKLNGIRRGVPCTLCKDQVSTYIELQKHLKQKHPETTIVTCPECEKPFTTRANMNSHRLTVHGVRPIYTCDSCPQTFDKYTNMISHRRTHLTCKLCGKTVSKYSEMKRHQLSHTTKSKKPPNSHKSKGNPKKKTVFKCLMCLCSFSRVKIEKHLWKCQAKMPCLNRIIEITTQIKEEPLDCTEYENALESVVFDSSEQTQQLPPSPTKQSKITGSESPMHSNGKNSNYEESLDYVSEEQTRVDHLACHNFLERKRRNNISDTFITLKNEIPELQPMEEVPRIMILNKAIEYVKGLKEKQQQLMSELEEQKEINEHLLGRRNLLEMDISSKHENGSSTD